MFQLTFTSRPDTASKLIVNDTVPPSVAVASAIDSTGLSSSSVMVTAVLVKVRLLDEPVIEIVSSSSSKSSSVGVKSKSTWAEALPAGIVIVNAPTLE